MIADDSYSGSIVSILNISCDVSRYSIHDFVYAKMYRDTIFMVEIYPDMYHDTVSLSVSSRLSCAQCFCGCTRASLVLFWFLEHTCLSRCFLSRFTVESVRCRNESIGRHPVSRVVQLTLGKYAALSVGVDSLSRVIDQVGNLEFSRYVQGALLWYEGE